MHFLKPTSEYPLFAPYEPTSGLFSVALKLFELLTYKFVTFLIYEFYTFSQIFKYTYGTLVCISPLDRAPGHFGQRIIVIKLILVDFDNHNANITLKICTDVVYINVYVV